MQDGFLHHRTREQRTFAINLPYWRADGTPGSVKFVYGCEKDADEVSEPVHTRAWTLEEWLLSPRLLVFTSEQIVWRCQGFQTVDSGRDPTPVRRAQDFMWTSATKVDVHRPRGSRQLWQCAWQSVTHQYTKRLLETHCMLSIILYSA